MSYTKCHCLHSKDVHELGTLNCSLCECTLYRPDTAADPFKNSVQQKTVRLLALARESNYAKTRKLGAKIEELLGELEVISEEEQTYKAELAKQEKERQKAEDELENARKLLAEAEERMSKFLPTELPKGRQRRSPNFNPKSLEIVSCDVPGCDWKDERRKLGVHKYSAHGIRRGVTNTFQEK